jgi:hypothetical protein
MFWILLLLRVCLGFQIVLVSQYNLDEEQVDYILREKETFLVSSRD